MVDIVPGQPGLCRESLSQKSHNNNNKINEEAEISACMVGICSPLFLDISQLGEKVNE